MRVHGLMRSIGLKYISTKKALEEVLEEVVESATNQKLVSVSADGENIVEFRKYFGENIGITVHGYYNENNEFIREYYFPFIDNHSGREIFDITLNRHIGKTSFAGICEDARIGVSLIFYLQNGIDFINYLLDERYSVVRAPLSFVGLAGSGTILLPINKSAKQIRKLKIANKNRINLISAAKKGDESAIENLTIEDLDLYSQISKRIRKEDVFTIVDNTFMPYGVECDHYMIMGDILSMKEIENQKSGEKIFYMELDCNDIKIDVVINNEDLMGEPMVGRRFKGSVWLQGIVDFEQ